MTRLLPSIVVALFLCVSCLGNRFPAGADFSGIATCVNEIRPDPFPKASDMLQIISRGAENFGLNTFKSLALTYNTANIVISPYSIWAVLKLAHYGAEGETKIQLQRALGLPSKLLAYTGGNFLDAKLLLDPGTTLNKLDAAYFEQTIPGLSDCAFQYIVNLSKTDLKNPAVAASYINRKVSEVTEGLIRNFVASHHVKGSRFLLVNAVYFKGDWKTPFPKTNTLSKPFYDESGRKKIGDVDMMSVKGEFNYFDSDRLEASIVELPYADSNFSMWVFIPYLHTKLTTVVSRLNVDSLQEIERSFKSSMATVNIPRFKMTTRTKDELKDALLSLGIVDVFNPGKSNLTAFTKSEHLFVSDALHHATIEVSETGTVAAAATIVVGVRSGVAKPLVFDANRPFLFLIREKSNGISLFTGAVLNPRFFDAF